MFHVEKSIISSTLELILYLQMAKIMFCTGFEKVFFKAKINKKNIHKGLL